MLRCCSFFPSSSSYFYIFCVQNRPKQSESFLSAVGTNKYLLRSQCMVLCLVIKEIEVKSMK